MGRQAAGKRRMLKISESGSLEDGSSFVQAANVNIPLSQ